MDRVSKEVRSKIMSRIKGRDTKPELKLRELVSGAGYRYRKNYRIGNKTVDLAFHGDEVAVMIDGCFWHGCPSCYKEPKSNKAYWKKKISANRLRDELTNTQLRQAGWKIVRIWEHEINKKPKLALRKVVIKL